MVFKGLEGSALRRFDRIKRKEEEREEEKEERRGNEVEAPLNHVRDQSLHRFLLCVLRQSVSFVFLRFECDLCTLRGPPLLFCAYSSPLSIIGNLVFL